MSEAKHTPGPWWATEEGVRDRGGFICSTRPAWRYPGQDERFEKETKERAANKLLIAAAPELLDALKVAMSRINDLLEADDGQAHKEARKALPKMESAIAKATGQP